MMDDQKQAGTSRRPRWNWVGADPDDTSPDAQFRREVAALAREVMLAHGAPEDHLPPAPPVDRSVSGGGAATADLRRGSDHLDVRATTPFVIREAGRAVGRMVSGEETGTGRPGRSPGGDLVLLAVARSGRGVGMRDLRRVTRLSASTISTVVGRLAGAGLVERRASIRDRRRTTVRATARGLRVAEQVAARWHHAEDRLLDGLSFSEREELRRLLRRATATLVEGRR